MDDPLVWAGIWLAAAVTLGIGEMALAGSFFLIPFALGAAAAGLVSLFGAPLAISWAVFVVGSIGAFVGLKPYARRLDLDLPEKVGVGANRLIGHEGIVTNSIPAGPSGTGDIKAGGEEWKAESANEMGLPQGTEIRIVEVRGTRVIVEPAPAAGLDRFV